MKEQNASLDVFRCLIMFLVVLGHAYFHGPFFQSDRILHFGFQSLIIWHVDAFLALSGWFGVRFSLSKFLRLWGLVAFSSVLSILVGRLVLHEPTRLAITGGWYGNTYLCLMLISPFLNAGIEGLVAKGWHLAWAAWAGFAAVMAVNWASGNSYVGLVAYDIGPFTLVQMVFVYLTVRLVRLTEIVEKVRLWHICLAVVLFVGGCLVIRGARTNYIAPYVIVMALAMLLVFERFVRVPQWLGRLGVLAAPSMFSVYLLHETTSFGQFSLKWAVARLAALGISPPLSIFFAAVCCFTVCVLLDGVRRLSLRLVLKGFRHAG